MRSAAQRQEDGDPGPAPEDPGGKAARVLDAHLALIERADALLGSWRDACPQDSQAVPALRELITETIGAGLHAEEMRQALAAYTGTAGSLSAAFAAGRAAERAALEAARPAPAPGRHAAERGGRRLKAVRDLPVAAFAGAAVALRHAWAAHPAWTAAAGATTVATLTAATAVVAPHAAATFGAGSPAPAPAASIYSAVPVSSPSQKLIAAVSGQKGSSRTLGAGLPPAYPSYAPQGPSAPAQDPGQVPAHVTVAGVLSVSTNALDLSGSGLGSLTLSCSGGPCSWHLVPGRDVGADTRQGSLQAGESATVGLSIDPAALLLGGSATVRIWPGDISVSVSWTAPPVQVPTVAPSILPTDLPTIAGT